ncbi:hypothetical protein WICMUC_000062 [Wickerhamomyces mucosus]|uniref:Cytosolic Fe-S cluster assembly factor NAR1 n=1 Tax=Wickerhamomyces mucosus TaxID=1378264 RepID=A0A9P8Q143_9ASCO|nr:hypothetical protein WICMUC_000062 [Wickerhamomyces mucosus]
MSALLSASDLNDFITPGLACIKPVEEVRASNTDEYEVQINSKGDPIEVSINNGDIRELPNASISLQDCLACSGCITSAEEVLLAKQTHTILIEDLTKWKDEKIFVFSISHQSRISMSLYLNLSLAKFDEFIINFLSEKYGFRFAVGTELARILSINQINSKIQQGKKNFNQHGDVKLSSICPGFVLYVEKTKPEILPYLLNVKSPQQITGLLLKHLLSKQLDIPMDQIYHLSIMPCFDKKLEAARPELINEVDCVLTPKEMIEFIKESNINILDYVTNSFDPPLELYKRAAPSQWPFPVESWDSNIGSASGGYALNYILESQLQMGGIIKEIKGKNSDVIEFQLIDGNTGDKLASSSIINGFRNIQNLVRKLKPSNKVKIGSGFASRRRQRKQENLNIQQEDSDIILANPSNCDFVEVMACPGGCINGGGLLEIDGTKRDEMIQRYNDMKQIDQLKKRNVIDEFLDQFKQLGNGLTEDDIFNYKFNKIEKLADVVSVGNKW